MKSSPRHRVEAEISEELEDATMTKTNLKGDWINFFLLLLLYTMQGLPLGIAGAMSVLLQSKKNVTYKDQAVYSITRWPFSLKLLWAPLVDALYVQKFGRRKSWLIPVQYSIGAILIYAASDIENLLPETGKPDITMLAYIFFMINFLAATQDIAVDGWALTMLKKNNVGYASTCNASGQTIGSMIGSMVLILFTSEEFCNKYFRSVPGVGGIVSVKNLLYGWGILFILITTLVGLFKKEKDNSFEDDSEKIKVVQNYLLLWDILKLPSVRILAILMITSKIGYAATDNVSTLKLMDAGVSKEDLSIIDSVMSGVNIITPFIIGKYTSGPKPMSLFLKIVPFRLLLNIGFVMQIYYTPKMITFNGENNSIYYYPLLVLLLSIQQILSQVMFVAILAFFSRISDPRFGCTYMTLLNTLANLGYMWTSTAALGMIDVLTFEECSLDSINNCSTIDLRNMCKANNGNCIVTVNGYYLEMLICTIIGIIWYFTVRKTLKSFQTKNLSHWLVKVKRTVTGNE
ncbi:acetyl-coenzyme A transporter 1-like [Myzus persicae]|uniref:acetyl-coenzyme A transporter 1-like n=1 Tax=Myzus persicae TaxID=13164 RepID=UPI000B939C6C|nr:acetyl-coenzyme A transporter 1-like [Myzus persicae]XP_022162907.1 acetyl-coenzyme A transporter 1-like [Myzus persicae]XP_022162908.1 acetyl-coenzyme A transporter 1-like [Myzus persicae]